MSQKHLLTLACLLGVAVGGASVFAQSAQKSDGGQDAPERRALAQVMALTGGNFLGVQTEELTRENAGRFQVAGEPRGVGVAQVSEGGPAAKAGLHKGDVIVRFDSEAVTSAAKLRRLIAEAAPEQTVRLAVLRGGAEREIVVKLGRREEGAFESFRLPEGQLFHMDGDEWKKQSEAWKLDGDELRRQLQNLPRLENMPQGNFAFAFAGGRRIGVATTPLTEQLADYFGVTERRGLLVTSVAADSPAAKAGIKAGDVITEADGEKLDEAGGLARVINRKDEGDVTLSVIRDRARRTVRVTPEKRERPEGFVLPRTESRGGRTLLVRPSAVAAPRLIAPRSVRPVTPRVIIPSRVRTMIL